MQGQGAVPFSPSPPVACCSVAPSSEPDVTVQFINSSSHAAQTHTQACQACAAERPVQQNHMHSMLLGRRSSGVNCKSIQMPVTADEPVTPTARATHVAPSTHYCPRFDLCCTFGGRPGPRRAADAAVPGVGLGGRPALGAGVAFLAVPGPVRMDRPVPGVACTAGNRTGSDWAASQGRYPCCACSDLSSCKAICVRQRASHAASRRSRHCPRCTHQAAACRPRPARRAHPGRRGQFKLDGGDAAAGRRAQAVGSEAGPRLRGGPCCGCCACRVCFKPLQRSVGKVWLAQPLSVGVGQLPQRAVWVYLAGSPRCSSRLGRTRCCCSCCCCRRCRRWLLLLLGGAVGRRVRGTGCFARGLWRGRLQGGKRGTAVEDEPPATPYPHPALPAMGSGRRQATQQAHRAVCQGGEEGRACIKPGESLAAQREAAGTGCALAPFLHLRLPCPSSTLPAPCLAAVWRPHSCPPSQPARPTRSRSPGAPPAGRRLAARGA